MFLYGSKTITSVTLDKWYLRLPEFWCKDKEYVKTHPSLEKPTWSWKDKNINLYDFYQLEIELIEQEKVMDLRVENWKEKLLTFIMWFGFGWVNMGGLWNDKSPLEHILFLGNYSIFNDKGYRWVVVNHSLKNSDEIIELWFYLDHITGPDELYKITKFTNTDF